jgi:hypothetical protein
MMPAPSPQGGAPAPEQVRQMLTQAVQELKKIAAENGIDLMELLTASPEPAPAPSPDMPRPPSALGQMQ